MLSVNSKARLYLSRAVQLVGFQGCKPVRGLAFHVSVVQVGANLRTLVVLGIGIETARAMYETGGRLFVTGRDLDKLNSVIDEIVANAEHNKDGPRPQGVEIHLDSLESVRKGAQDFVEKSGGKLNILIDNAGVMACPYSTTKDGLELQIGVNHFAHFLLFQMLKPCLLASAKESGTASRVVNLTSAGHRYSGIKFSNKVELDAWNEGKDYQKWQAYGQAKTANIHMANSINRRYGGEGLVGLSVHPGGIMTNLARHLTPEDFEVYDWAKIQHMFKNTSQGAATTVWAAVSEHFEGKNGGRYLADVGETSPAIGDMLDPGYFEWAYDEATEETLWNISCEVVGVEKD